MFDLRWKLIQGLMWALSAVARGNGKFVFAVAARPVVERAEVVVADTSSIRAVRAIVDHIIEAHIDGTLPEQLRGVEVVEQLPARSWKVEDGTPT